MKTKEKLGSEEIEARAEALREQAAALTERADEAAEREAFEESLKQTALEAETIAYVYGALLALNHAGVQGRVVEYVVDKLGINASSAGTRAQLKNLNQDCALKANTIGHLSQTIAALHQRLAPGLNAYPVFPTGSVISAIGTKTYFDAAVPR